MHLILKSIVQANDVLVPETPEHLNLLLDAFLLLAAYGGGSGVVSRMDIRICSREQPLSTGCNVRHPTFAVAWQKPFACPLDHRVRQPPCRCPPGCIARGASLAMKDSEEQSQSVAC